MAYSRKVHVFNSLYESAIALGTGNVVDYRCCYPKHEFLEFLVEHKGILLHGSNNQNIDILRPKRAKCLAKKFGNMKAVYAMSDGVLPFFYAIIDQERFRGRSECGCHSIIDNQNVVHRFYYFAVSAQMLELRPWSSGMVYILSRVPFEQGTDDDGNPINEWASKEPVLPLAKLPVDPEDFPFLNNIQAIEENRPQMGQNGTLSL